MDGEKSEKIVREFVQAMIDLRKSVDVLGKATTEQTKTIRELIDKIDETSEVLEEVDEHNATLYTAMENLANRLDLIKGVGSLVSNLLPARRR